MYIISSCYNIDTFERVDSFELSGLMLCCGGKILISCSPDYVRSLAKNAQQCCQTDVYIEVSHMLLLFSCVSAFIVKYSQVEYLTLAYIQKV